jgi:hypothetical protein
MGHQRLNFSNSIVRLCSALRGYASAFWGPVYGVGSHSHARAFQKEFSGHLCGAGPYGSACVFRFRSFTALGHNSGVGLIGHPYVP